MTIKEFNQFLKETDVHEDYRMEMYKDIRGYEEFLDIFLININKENIQIRHNEKRIILIWNKGYVNIPEQS